MNGRSTECHCSIILTFFGAVSGTSRASSLFRAISKSITGTQKNHSALSAAMLEFVVHPDNVVAIGRFLEGSHIRDVDKACDAVESYSRDRKMSHEKTWGTNIEISVITLAAAGQ